VNEALARKYFAGRRAVGQRIGMDGKLDTEIIGVVRDARVLGVRDEPVPAVFYAMAQSRQGARVVEVRTHGDPRAAVASVRRALAEAVPEVPVTRVMARADRVSLNLSQDRLILSLSSVFGALALGLAGFGLFGILSFAVARRTAEFGIRIALGASGRRVCWSVCREALVIGFAGVALGLPIVVSGARAMRTLLFGVAPQDWSAFAGAAAVLLLVAALAGLLPAWRASRVDPVIALRME
jgi:ABC-type antimicrobial peptide transport system permease subunit